MKQTIIQIGNSAGVIIPAELRKKYDLQVGDKVEITKQNGFIVISPHKADSRSSVSNSKPVSQEFKKWVDLVLREDKDLLDELELR